MPEGKAFTVGTTEECGLQLAAAEMQAVIAAARRNGTTLGQEAIAAGFIDEATLYRNKAAWIGLPFLDGADGGEVGDVAFLDRQLLEPRLLRMRRDARGVTLVVP